MGDHILCGIVAPMHVSQDIPSTMSAPGSEYFLHRCLIFGQVGARIPHGGERSVKHKSSPILGAAYLVFISVSPSVDQSLFEATDLLSKRGAEEISGYVCSAGSHLKDASKSPLGPHVPRQGRLMGRFETELSPKTQKRKV